MEQLAHNDEYTSCREPLLAEQQEHSSGSGIEGAAIVQVVEGEEAAAEEEAPFVDWLGRTSPSRHGGWTAASFLLGSHCLQSVATSGCTVNLVIFLVRKMHQTNSSAANVITNWIGTTFLTSILGAALGDAHWGRLWTSVFFQVLYVMGLILFCIMGSIITADETQPVSIHVILLYTSLYTMGVGIASLAPNAVSLGADQFDSPKQTSAFISLSMASSSVGLMFSTSIISYVENEGQWRLGFWLSAGFGVMGLLLFLAGTPIVRQHKPGKNPLFCIAQVLYAAMCNHKSSEVDGCTNSPAPINFYKRDGRFRWLDKAAATKKHLGCTMEQVESVKSIFRLLPFWVSGILVASVLAQKGTFFVLQGDIMDNRVSRGMKFPPASMGLFSLATVVMGAPVFTLLTEPYAKRHNRENFSIGRMGAGLVVAIVMFCIAAVTESQRLRTARSQDDARMDDGKRAPMSIFWLTPQYVLDGLTTVLFAAGHLEFNYMYAPQGMKSLATAMSLSGFALGNYLSSLLVSVVASFTSWIPNDLNKGHLDYYYWLLAALLSLDLVFFVASSKWAVSSLLELPCSDPGLDEECQQKIG